MASPDEFGKAQNNHGEPETTSEADRIIAAREKWNFGANQYKPYS